MTDEQFETMHEMLSALYVQISRSYDMLVIIGDKLGADTVRLSKEHEQGRLVGPAPYLEETDDQ